MNFKSKNKLFNELKLGGKLVRDGYSEVTFTIKLLNAYREVVETLTVDLYDKIVSIHVKADVDSESFTDNFCFSKMDDALNEIVKYVECFVETYNKGYTLEYSVNNDKFKDVLTRFPDGLNDLGAVGMRSRAKRAGKNDDSNIFQECILADIFFEDREYIEFFLRDVKEVHSKLSQKEQQKPIFVNFDGCDKCGYASYSRNYLLMSEPINNCLAFESDEELEDCVNRLMELHYNHYKKGL